MKDKTRDFERLICRILKEEGWGGEGRKRKGIKIYFTDNEQMRDLNRKFRGIDRATDVLSFPINEKNDLGEIVISEKYARNNVEQLVIHGVLHLLGCNHEKVRERKIMREKEERYLK